MDRELSHCLSVTKQKNQRNQISLQYIGTLRYKKTLHYIIPLFHCIDWILLLYFKGLFFTVVTKSIINVIKNILLASPKITNNDNLVHITVLLLNSQSFVCLSEDLSYLIFLFLCHAFENPLFYTTVSFAVSM